MNAEIVQIQWWRYKTIVVTKRQQQTNISLKIINFKLFSYYLTHMRNIRGLLLLD